MKRTFLLALLAAACSSPTLVVAARLAPGGGTGGGGGAANVSGDTLDILVLMESDATDFNPGDLIRLLVNGVDRTEDVVLGGHYGLLRLDPSPIGAVQFVELFRRTGPVLDTFTFNPVALGAGPTLANVVPDQARVGEQVVLSGSGFDGGPVRVFLGGIEATVVAFDPTSVTVTVPAGAIPGLAYVLVGAEAAQGVVPFRPLDAAGQPVPAPTSGMRLFAAFPGRGRIETVVEIWGLNLDDRALPRFNDRFSSRIFPPETVTLPLIGDVERSFAVVGIHTMPGTGFLRLDLGRNVSNELPFTVDGP